MRDSAGFSALKDGPMPEGIDLKPMKPWYPNMDDHTNLQEQYAADWNKLNHYRQ